MFFCLGVCVLRLGDVECSCSRHHPHFLSQFLLSVTWGNSRDWLQTGTQGQETSVIALFLQHFLLSSWALLVLV